MDNQILLAVLAAIALGALTGYVVGRWRRVPPAPPPLTPEDRLRPDVRLDTLDEETKPTLVPFRPSRESGKNLAKLNEDP
jgi:hypothetical protein